MATDMGSHHFDCAAACRNEAEVGKAIKVARKRNGLELEDVWITGKLWNVPHGDPISAWENSVAGLDRSSLPS